MKPTLLLLILLFLPTQIEAESEVFKLNGKPVPVVVAKVNGNPLKAAQLESEFITFQLRAQAQGKKISPSEEVIIGREMLKALIMKELITQKALSLNISIPSKKIELEIQNIEDKFPDHSAFITALAFQRMSIKTLKEKIKRTLLEDELIRNEIAPKVKINDEDAKSFYESNKEKFTKPVLYRVRHILIGTIQPPKNLENKVDQKKATRMAKMINEEAKSNAEAVLLKIKAGEDFIKLAKEYSEDKTTYNEGGMLGDLHPESTIPEIADEMVKLNEGQTSNIFHSTYGYHILKLDEIIPSTLIPFEKAESDILNILMKKETQRMFKKYIITLEKNAKIEIFI
tara:strand:+ start:1615 stop:2640 length:1026 start_codon:yes stop_codon:yes gene_type:complete